MTASAPPESDLLPPEEAPPFRASAPPEASLALSPSPQELPPSPPSPQCLLFSPPSPQDLPLSPQSVVVVSDIESSQSPLIFAPLSASLASLTQSPSGSESQSLALPPPPLLSQRMCASSHSQVSLQSTSLTSIETSLINDCDDIGLLLHSFPQNRIRNLPAPYKYLLYSNHFKPSSSFKFPGRYSDGCNRACQHKYFVYSKSEDGIFCLPCVLFATKDNLGQFVCKKFHLWSKKSIKFSAHNSKQYHSIALSRMDALTSSMAHPESSIENLIRQINETDIARNRFILKCITEAILFCGRQCISLRGHRDGFKVCR